MEAMVGQVVREDEEVMGDQVDMELQEGWATGETILKVGMAVQGEMVGMVVMEDQEVWEGREAMEEMQVLVEYVL